VPFEIIGADPSALRSYYGGLFGWEFDTSSPVSDAVSEPANHGFVAPDASSGGIPGGVGGGQAYSHRATFSVGVSDVEAALQKAESLGGTRAMGPARAQRTRRRPLHRPRRHLIGVAATA
jgi:uncharacterized protein